MSSELKLQQYTEIIQCKTSNDKIRWLESISPNISKHFEEKNVLETVTILEGYEAKSHDELTLYEVSLPFTHPKVRSKSPRVTL